MLRRDFPDIRHQGLPGADRHNACGIRHGLVIVAVIFGAIVVNPAFVFNEINRLGRIAVYHGVKTQNPVRRAGRFVAQISSRGPGPDDVAAGYPLGNLITVEKGGVALILEIVSYRIRYIQIIGGAQAGILDNNPEGQEIAVSDCLTSIGHAIDLVDDFSRSGEVGLTRVNNRRADWPARADHRVARGIERGDDIII